MGTIIWLPAIMKIEKTLLESSVQIQIGKAVHKSSKPKREYDALEKEYTSLSVCDVAFNYLQRAERANRSHDLCSEAYNLANKEPTQKTRDLHHRAAKLFHRCLNEAYPVNFWQEMSLLKKGDLAGLESAVQFLESDPWFHRAGYDKADVLRYVARAPLTDQTKLRLRRVILNAIDLRDRREFKHYANLAKHISDTQFRDELVERQQSEDEGVRRRAKWVLTALNSI